MKAFLDDDFLLTNDTATLLFHRYAEHLPIIDYHCHVSPKDIAEDKRYQNISELWLGGDHYKWRLIRADGIPEHEITGAIKNDPLTLFRHYGRVLPKAVGNPLYHWSYMELKKYFGIETPLTPKTADDLYARLKRKLGEPGMSVRGLIAQSNVKLICTTDDPIDDLRWHRAIKAEKDYTVSVLPAFRPDKVLNIDKPGFLPYIKELERVSGITIRDFFTLCEALNNRIFYFAELGCRASDHALETCVYAAASQEELDGIISKVLTGNAVNMHEAEQYRTAVLLSLSRQYHERNWVMEIHIGCRRNNDTLLFEALGPDVGTDSMNGDTNPATMASLLNQMRLAGTLPRTLLFSLNPGDSEILVSIAGCFTSDAECAGKVQIGSAWWFNDTKTGMEKQMTDFANGTLLGNFVGMLTDSRSFLSYVRHDYFRRILCNFLGRMVERGECHPDLESLGQLVKAICYDNAVRFFGFNVT